MSFRYFAAFVVVALTLVQGIAFSVQLSAGQKKCYSDHIGKSVLVVASAVAEDGKQLLGMSLSDSSQTIYSASQLPELKTAFTTVNAGPHHLCVENNSKGIGVAVVTFVWGPEARDYSQVAKKEHLDGVIQTL
eukprot:Polyplicarium_translucidae@DN914_c0_g1_i3.p1